MGTNGRLSLLGRTAAVAALLGALVACASGEKERAQLADIQHQADEKVSQVQNAANAKMAEAQKRIDDLQRQLADAGTRARAEMQEELDRAKAEADKLAAEAALALGRARTAYKESANRQFIEVLKDADDLHLKAAKLPPKVKAPIDKAIKDIAAKKGELTKDINAFDTATLDTLRTTKAKVDVHLHELRQMLRAARAKLPS